MYYKTKEQVTPKQEVKTKEQVRPLQKLDYTKFLACDKQVLPYGNKSNLDNLDFDIIYQTFKFYKSIEDINKMCLTSNKMKTICCNNRQKIFVKILEYLGYTKKITNDNAEVIFSWIDTTNKNSTKKLVDFYIGGLSLYDKPLAIIILLSINNKLTINDIDNKKQFLFWWYYPIIYYYTPNINIKKFILDEYNKITMDLINTNRRGFYFITNNFQTGMYIKNTLLRNLGELTHENINHYSILEVNYLKQTVNQFISY